jgi:hypothetical protein
MCDVDGVEDVAWGVVKVVGAARRTTEVRSRRQSSYARAGWSDCPDRQPLFRYIGKHDHVQQWCREIKISFSEVASLFSKRIRI